MGSQASMTKSTKSLKTVWHKLDANTLASEDLMSLPTSLTKGLVVGELQLEAELAVA